MQKLPVVVNVNVSAPEKKKRRRRRRPRVPVIKPQQPQPERQLNVLPTYLGLQSQINNDLVRTIQTQLSSQYKQNNREINVTPYYSNSAKQFKEIKELESEEPESDPVLPRRQFALTDTEFEIQDEKPKRLTKRQKEIQDKVSQKGTLNAKEGMILGATVPMSVIEDFLKDPRNRNFNGTIKKSSAFYKSLSPELKAQAEQYAKDTFTKSKTPETTTFPNDLIEEEGEVQITRPLKKTKKTKVVDALDNEKIHSSTQITPQIQPKPFQDLETTDYGTDITNTIDK